MAYPVTKAVANFQSMQKAETSAPQQSAPAPAEATKAPISAGTTTPTSTAAIDSEAPEGKPEPVDTLELTEADYDNFYNTDFEIKGVPLLDKGKSFKGLVPLEQLVDRVHPEVAKHIYNLKAHYTRRTQQLAETQRQLEAERQTLQADRQNISNAYQAIQKQLTEAPELTDDDIWSSTENLSKFNRKEALKAVADVFKPLQDEIATTEKKVAEDKAVNEAKTFIASHSEFQDSEFKSAVTELVKQSYPLEAAYYTVKAKYEQEQKSYDSKIDTRNRTSASKQTLMKSGIGGKIQPKPSLKGLSAQEKYRAIENYERSSGKSWNSK